jgi:hypothetical protein
MSNDIIIIISIFVPVFILMIIFSYKLDKHCFNNGICPNCGTNLQLPSIMIDSKGGRGWTCPGDKCEYTAWVTWPIDRKYRKKMER